jgi:uncharacterized protein (AIM24 family)
VQLASFSLAHRLAAPAGEHLFTETPKALLIQVRGALLTRVDGLIAAWGSVQLHGELKRFRGRATDKPFGEGARHMLRATGEGRFAIAREGRTFTPVELGDQPGYFREESLYAFEDTLLFENGRVPSRTGGDLHLVHLRGRGQLLLLTLGTPRAIEVTKGVPVRVPMDQLVGWHGPAMQPRLLPLIDEVPELGLALELTGEGTALIDAPEGT